MLRIFIFLLGGLLCTSQIHGFCGFYVAKADAKLFNKSSQVILVRSGERSVITMSNDFDGKVDDFAMVVPVPVVLKKNQIRTVKQELFDNVDAYSAPRLAEYYDADPCYVPQPMSEIYFDGMTYNLCAPTSDSFAFTGNSNRYASVKIEAKYEVDEYNILILSAKQSDGLINYLNDHDYKLPENAMEVLTPYIKSGMNFFLAKVDASRLNKGKNGEQLLSPLQIEFQHHAFSLPIRLGMANANGDQDLIIHAYTDRGRVECSNYRTVEMPHDVHIPQFIKSEFNDFYKTVFDRQYIKEHQNAVFLEYAWDVSPFTSVKCDPCVGPPPVNQQLVNAGVNWVEEPNAKIHYTRLHVRYNRQNFPQDLKFQVTPNTKRFQCRYVITNPPSNNNFECDKGQAYLKELLKNRKQELYELAVLTGRDISKHESYITDYSQYLNDGNTGALFDTVETQTGTLSKSSVFLSIVCGITLLLGIFKMKS